jgi:hypothetical protein
MVNKTSSEECNMCEAIVEEELISCCSEMNQEYRLILSSSNSQCCEDEFIFNKIDDEFIFNKIEVSYTEKQIIADDISHDILADQNYFSVRTLYCDSSPPFLINPEIHINNRSLLI